MFGTSFRARLSGLLIFVAFAPATAAETLLRIGLATDLARFEAPCCDSAWRVAIDGGVLALEKAALIEPAPGITGKAIYRVQVTALKDEAQAQGLADWLGRELKTPSAVSFDATSGLFRVRIGAFSERARAEALQPKLEAFELGAGWVVAEGGDLHDPAFLIRQGNLVHQLKGRFLRLESGGVPLSHNGLRFRGDLLLYLNDRGLLNLINEVALEDYLRGVVPKEFGPELYDQIEAQKAQAIAARTFALRNRGEFAAEGYDLCATPRCQVYGGMAVEHPLSDRAIAETRNLVVLWRGEPIEAMYTATSGGHTENVEVMFPKKRAPYLRGVPCVEAGATSLAGKIATRFPMALVERLLPAEATGPAVLQARLEQLAVVAGLGRPKDRMRGDARAEASRAEAGRAEAWRFITSVFDLVLDPDLAAVDMATNALAERLDSPPASWQERDRALARLLVELDFGTRATEPLSPADQARLVLALALYLGAIEEQQAYFLAADERRLNLRLGARRLAFDLPADVLTIRADGTAKALELTPGDPVRVFFEKGQIVALVERRPAVAVDLERHAARQRWTDFKSDQELAATIHARFPDFRLSGLQVLSRGVSQRVGRLRLIGAGGREEILEGLAVRFTLELWDNLFWVERAREQAKSGWRFHGRGWGHGVGMSQAGAYAMAKRGASSVEILEHYYSGVEIGKYPGAKR